MSSDGSQPPLPTDAVSNESLRRDLITSCVVSDVIPVESEQTEFSARDQTISNDELLQPIESAGPVTEEGSISLTKTEKKALLLKFISDLKDLKNELLETGRSISVPSDMEFVDQQCTTSVQDNIESVGVEKAGVSTLIAQRDHSELSAMEAEEAETQSSGQPPLAESSQGQITSSECSKETTIDGRRIVFKDWPRDKLLAHLEEILRRSNYTIEIENEKREAAGRDIQIAEDIICKAALNDQVAKLAIDKETALQEQVVRLVKQVERGEIQLKSLNRAPEVQTHSRAGNCLKRSLEPAYPTPPTQTEEQTHEVERCDEAEIREPRKANVSQSGPTVAVTKTGKKKQKQLAAKAAEDLAKQKAEDETQVRSDHLEEYGKFCVFFESVNRYRENEKNYYVVLKDYHLLEIRNLSMEERIQAKKDKNVLVTFAWQRIRARNCSNTIVLYRTLLLFISRPDLSNKHFYPILATEVIWFLFSKVQKERILVNYEKCVFQQIDAVYDQYLKDNLSIYLNCETRRIRKLELDEVDAKLENWREGLPAVQNPIKFHKTEIFQKRLDFHTRNSHMPQSLSFANRYRFLARCISSKILDVDFHRNGIFETEPTFEALYFLRLFHHEHHLDAKARLEADSREHKEDNSEAK